MIKWLQIVNIFEDVMKNKLKYLVIFLLSYPYISYVIRQLLKLFIPKYKNNSSGYVRYKKFYEYFQNKQFADQYTLLTTNLDNRSVDNINFIMQITTKIVESKYHYFCYLDYTYFKIRLAKLKFEKQIVNFNNTIYSYNDYFLTINMFTYHVFYYKKGLLQLKNLDSLKDKNIFDIGASIGDSMLILSKFTNKKVYSFEPLKISYHYLTQAIILNQLSDKIIAENIALGSITGKHEIKGNFLHTDVSSLSINNYTVTELDSKFNFTEQISVDTLDNYCKNNNIDSVGLISVDVEGAEQLFLKGAIDTIKKFKPTLIISIYHNPDDFFNIKNIIENYNLGYKFSIYRFPGEVLGETILVCEIY
jgi:FkbM family methyltransferase